MNKKWYKTWWGITLCILFLGCGTIIYISETISDNKLKKEAIEALDKGDIDKSLSLIEKVSEATNLKEDIKEAKQLNFIYELGRLTDDEYEALKNNSLNKKYFNSEEVNKYVINKIKSI